MAERTTTDDGAELESDLNSVTVESRNWTKSPPGLLMTHTVCGIQSPLSTSRGVDSNIVAGASEQSRMYRGGTPTSVQEIRPVVAQTCTHQRPAMSLTSWLSMRLQDRQNSTTRGSTTPMAAVATATTTTTVSDSYVINVDDDSLPETMGVSNGQVTEDRDYHNATVTDNYLNNIREATAVGAANNNNNNNNNNEEDVSVTLPFSSETRDILCSLFDVFNKCLPFAIILLSKCIYDYKSSIIEFLGLLVAFMSANRDLKREIAKQQNRSWKILLSILVYISGCFFAMDYIFEEPLVRMYTVPTTMSELLWSVVITDMVLKLATVALKVFVTCLPGKILPYQKRGKYYLAMEACSQFYRSTATVYPWFFYLWDCYGGSEAFIAHLFAVIYTNSKFSDVVPRGKLLWSSLKKMWQNRNLGTSPSKDQLIASGPVCVICHEEYSNPVLLQCNHIFCESCVTTWLDRECTCPLCRAPITDDPVYRDGHTTDFIQWY